MVSRQEIVGRLWGKDVFVDTEHGINTAIRKVRQALKDDPDKPRFIHTIGQRLSIPGGEGRRSRTFPLEDPAWAI